MGYSDNDKSLLKLEYDYGTSLQNNGSLRQQKISYAGLSSQITQGYTYDNLNRLQSATETAAGTQTPTWKQTFDYDRHGNRTFNAGNTTTLSQNVSAKITNPIINTSDNRLKKDQDNDTITDYDYDRSGNLTLDAENRRFVYDAENRQTAFFAATNNTQTPDATYEYDGEGKRVRKISGQTETIFVYNASGQLIAEYFNELPAEPKTSYLTSDHLGSPRIITDEGGIVISRHDYRVFGDEIQAGVANRTTDQGYSSDDEIRKQYTGYERDKESGLDFAQARYYNSAHGRFTSVDPLTASASIRNPQTFNRYSYVLNSPYKFIDPLGLYAKQPKDCHKKCIEIYGEIIKEDSDRLEELEVENENNASPPPVTQTSNNRAGYGEVVSWSRSRIEFTRWTETRLDGVLIGIDGPVIAGYFADVTEATIIYSPVNLGATGPLPANAKGRPKQFDGDQRGHIIGRALGGSDDDSNLFSQSGSVNNSPYRKFENQIRRTLTDHKTWTAYVTVTLIFRPFAPSVAAARADPRKYQRPVAVRYSVVYRNQSNQRVKSRSLVFSN